MATLLLRPTARLPITLPRAQRLFRFNSSLAAGTTRAPDHPHLYFHASPAPPAAAQSLILTFTPGRPTEFLSFLPLGTAPVLPSGGPDLTAFQEHPYFRSVFNAAIRDALDKGGNKGLEYEAARRGCDGYITIKGASSTKRGAECAVATPGAGGVTGEREKDESADTRRARGSRPRPHRPTRGHYRQRFRQGRQGERAERAAAPPTAPAHG